MRARRRSWGIAAAAVIVTSACGSGQSMSTTTSASATATTVVPTTASAASGPCHGAARPDRYEHVVWIWMENHEVGSVIGSADAPYETVLARSCATVERYGSVGAPSLPNYIGATSGDVHGIHDDAPPSVHPVTADNLFRQVRAIGGSARSYQESMSVPCALTAYGRYAPKHNPAAYYTGADDRQACQRDDVALGDLTSGALATDLATGALPTFAFITPDLCDDTHDCPVPDGDAWLSRWLGAILASPTYAQGRTAVFLVWDEPTPMPFIAVAPAIVPGTVGTGTFDHYALLRATEDLLGLPAHIGAAATARDLRTALGL